MSSIQEPTADQWLHGLFLYTTVFIILAGAQYFDEFLIISGVKMVRLNPFFPHFAQMTAPALLMILLANIHAKYRSVQFTVSTRDVILAFAIGSIILLEIFHAYFSGNLLQLEYAYDLLLILLCLSALKSFDLDENYIIKIQKVIIITMVFVVLLCLLAIIFDFSHTTKIFLDKNCAKADLNIISYFFSPCRPITDFTYKIAQISPFIIALSCWCLLGKVGRVYLNISIILLLVFIVGFTKSRLPWMLSLSILALAGLFAIYRSKGLKMASAAVLLGILLLATTTFFFSETVERLLSLNRGVLPGLEAEIRNWDIEMMAGTGLLLRYELFLEGLRAFAESPFIGQGLGASMGDGTHKELLHGIPLVYAVGYGLVGLTAFVALFFPRIGKNIPNDWLFMKVSLLIVVIGTSFHLHHPPFWYAAAAMFLQMPHEKLRVKGSRAR